MCPSKSFHDYISHLNPNCEALWQSPISISKTSVWYSSQPVGDYIILDFMKKLSNSAKLSQLYTNHDIRVTGLSILGRCNFSDKQIMSISGHKSVESLKGGHVPRLYGGTIFGGCDTLRWVRQGIENEASI